MSNKTIIKPDFQFPRSWTDVDKDNNSMSFTCQPYITGLYVATTNASSLSGQFGVDWKKVSKLVKELQKSETVTGLDLQPIGDYLSESDLSIINS